MVGQACRGDADHVRRSRRDDRSIRRAARRRADQANSDVNFAFQSVSDDGEAGEPLHGVFYRAALGSSGKRTVEVAVWHHVFELQLRLVVLAGTLGMVAFSLLLPMFTYLFRRGVRSFEARGSIPHSLIRLASPAVIADVLKSVRLPRLAELRAFDWRVLPKRLLIFNTVVMCVYAIGVQASYLASVLDPNVARTAIGLSGVINGIGTIAFTLFVDPTSSMITDQAIHGKRTVEEVRSMVFYLSLTAILGSLLSQAILYPAAVLIKVVALFAMHAHI